APVAAAPAPPRDASPFARLADSEAYRGSTTCPTKSTAPLTSRKKNTNGRSIFTGSGPPPRPPAPRKPSRPPEPRDALPKVDHAPHEEHRPTHVPQEGHEGPSILTLPGLTE